MTTKELKKFKKLCKTLEKSNYEIRLILLHSGLSFRLQIFNVFGELVFYTTADSLSKMVKEAKAALKCVFLKDKDD